MKLILLVLTTIILELQSEDVPIETTVIESVVDNQSIDQTQLKKKEQQQQLESASRSEIYPWVLQQLRLIKKIKQFPNAQSFMIRLKPQAVYEFKWIPNSKKSPLQMMVMVFTEQRGSDLSVIRNPSQQNYIAVQSKHISIQIYKLHVKVYLSKIFTFDFNTKDRYIRFRNTHSIEVIVEISLEQTELYLRPWQIAKNDNFYNAAQKMQSLYEEMRARQNSRSKTFKWEWGFLDLQAYFDEQMLKITALELLIIIATAIVQLYCVKTLFHQNQIV